MKFVLPWQNVVFALLIGALFAFALWFNQALAVWRLGEVDDILQSFEVEKTRGATALLLGKMELLRARADRGQETEGDDLLEARLQVMAAADTPAPAPAIAREGWETVVVKAVVGVLRSWMGKAPMVSLAAADPLRGELDRAYLNERGRRYAASLALYRQVLAEPGLAAELTATVLLHAGFCWAMTSEFDQAVSAWQRVVAEQPGTEAAAAATQLLQTLAFLRQKVASGPTGSALERGKWAYLLADYAKAEALLKQGVAEGGDQADLLFYLGRVAEETGRPDEALAYYDDSLQRAGPAAPVAERSRVQRRLYLLGAVYEARPDLAAQAQKALELQGDTAWLDALPTPVQPAAQASATNPPAAEPAPAAPEAASEATAEGVAPVAEAPPVQMAPPAASEDAPTPPPALPLRSAPALAAPEPLAFELLGPTLPSVPERRAPRLEPLALDLPTLGAGYLSPERHASDPGPGWLAPAGWIAGATLAATFGVSLWVGNTAYTEYKSSTDAARVAALRTELVTLQVVDIAAAVAGSLSLVTAAFATWWPLP